ncbi:exonuclease [Desulfonema ishimotonii]|uniref:Exonuclease n=1 Tax=Desulfonema ishimotonii TaxID=45657 RepID=A0A401G2D3_9BACT|nr:recombination-associated protein RdgC [Desulfonema ishimotonii]GBC63387.1 exonuclease [Desulfonema ishimotonii]
MGLLSSTVSVTRYKVNGELEEPVLETIAEGLKKNVIQEIEEDVSEKSVGWTSFENHFRPDFEGSSFVIGTHMVFCLRIDKKSIPSKIIKKHCAIETARKLAETGRENLTRSEKQAIKEHVTNVLSLRIPATPSIYELLWHYEDKSLWFFSNQKAANEELETLFSKSFKMTLVRLFPYTMGELTAGLSEIERDALSKLSPTSFRE